jgi:beta-mannosidase
MEASTRRRLHGRAGGFVRRLTGALLVLALGAPLSAVAASLATQSLDAGWQFRLAPGDRHAAEHPQAVHWLSATVPGTVQTDLLAAKLVSDPYWRDNEAKIQ